MPSHGCLTRAVLTEFLQPLWLPFLASVKTRLPSATSYTFFVWACPPYRRSGFSFQCLAICSCVARHFHCNPSRAYLNYIQLLYDTKILLSTSCCYNFTLLSNRFAKVAVADLQNIFRTTEHTQVFRLSILHGRKMLCLCAIPKKKHSFCCVSLRQRLVNFWKKIPCSWFIKR